MGVRVSAALIRPGANGLANDVADVERLTELGRAVLDRLGSAAVLAGVVTAGGRRTWLVYVAGADQADVKACVRQAVRPELRRAGRLRAGGDGRT